MDDVAEIAVVRRRGVAHDRVRPRGAHGRQLRARIEPDRGVGPSPALARQLANDARRLDVRTAGGARDRARDQHRRMIHGLCGQIGVGGLGEKRGKLAGDGHGSLSWSA